jgi:hypothetical protein
MPIGVVCRSCDRSINLKDELAGRRIKCPGCGKVLAVPDEEAVERPVYGTDVKKRFIYRATVSSSGGFEQKVGPPLGDLDRVDGRKWGRPPWVTLTGLTAGVANKWGPAGLAAKQDPAGPCVNPPFDTLFPTRIKTSVRGGTSSRVQGARATCRMRSRNRGMRGHSGPLPVRVRGAPLADGGEAA